MSPVEISAFSVNEFTLKLSELFLSSMNKKIIKHHLPVLFFYADVRNLSHRTKSIELNWRNKIRKKMSRVEKLLQNPTPYSREAIEGFFVYFTDFNHAFVSYSAITGACQRMCMDKNAPSRSYLKVEEAYTLINCQPQANEQVVDLGAAPGGWAYSALKRKAKVIAVDNAQLNKTISAYPGITHLKQDALKFIPSEKLNADWLFCDTIENPEIILQVIQKWLQYHWCRRFIVNLKIGRCDPMEIIKKINSPDAGLLGYCSQLEIRHLYHNRQEITLAGIHI